ncbi:trypsin-like peptidase domain-containing protein [Aestuariibaculum sp. YM273]|uniref:trypsin-like peptidase domain-containing protein n=1 Tax=Aestuariibaculum sp. YM273 TaxID=3070659 RepID=UPI0027DD1091|nr:trypsin-like peptidase domain-containing protein [Aestuariibaculum sp. YM273]WMI64103.1 trypsin-like peptidase domain-containing protein [Aestuariibaculum sp. YM273]
MKKIFLLIFLVTIFNCKKNPPEPTELYNKFRNSVVLIQNSYYFKTSLDNGFEFFYTIENDEPVFFEDEEEARLNAGISFGTGFFISKNGELATNRHVIYPSKNNELVGEQINEYLENLRYKVKKAINETQSEQSKLVDLWNEYYDYLDYDKKAKIKDEYSSKKNDVLELEQLLENLNFNPINTITELKRVFLGVAFDDTHVTSINDFKECVAIKKSDDENVDLAIIQLKDKITPQRITTVFSLEKLHSNEELKLNDNVYMIGFNHGFSLANTDNGIKSQFTHGTITQDPDMNRILYSIPTLPGSSGSPVIDKWGNLVAINFAKTSDFQGFSFGVPALQLTSLYKNLFINENKVSKTNELNHFTEQKLESNINQAKPSEYYENKIRGLLNAEDQRDFNTVISFYDLNNIKRYWDNSNPSYDELSQAYYKAWKATEQSSNSIISINKEWERIYDVNLDYTFYHKRSEEWKTVNSTVRFVFGQNEKIIEVYGIDSKTLEQSEASSNDSTTGSFSDTGEYLYVTTFDNPVFELSLYEKPDINSIVRYKCPKNAQVKVIEKHNETFYKVIVNGYSGFVSRKWLKRQF